MMTEGTFLIFFNFLIIWNLRTVCTLEIKPGNQLEKIFNRYNFLRKIF